jgi:hypothetical protein
MSYKIFCDYCGREILDKQKTARVKVYILEPYHASDYEARATFSIDVLCAFCTTLFRGTIAPWKSPPTTLPNDSSESKK